MVLAPWTGDTNSLKTGISVRLCIFDVQCLKINALWLGDILSLKKGVFNGTIRFQYTMLEYRCTIASEILCL